MMTRLVCQTCDKKSDHPVPTGWDINAWVDRLRYMVWVSREHHPNKADQMKEWADSLKGWARSYCPKCMPEQYDMTETMKAVFDYLDTEKDGQ